MANLLQSFNPSGLITQKLKEIDPELDVSKKGIINQLLSHFINKNIKIGEAARQIQQPEPVTTALPNAPSPNDPMYNRPPQTPQNAPQSPTVQSSVDDPFIGLSQVKPPTEYHNLIKSASESSGVPQSVLSSILFTESGYRPQAINGEDRGIAQINRTAYPDVTDKQANDPNFAIPFMANEIAKYYKTKKNWGQAIASYNVGPGRTGEGVGRDENGLGPYGRVYVTAVRLNLKPDYADLLGLPIYSEEQIKKDKAEIAKIEAEKKRLNK